MLTVKILGPGCANCRRLEELVRKVAHDGNIDAEVVKVTDYPGIAAHGILATPGLIVNDKVVSQGRIPAPSSIAEWLAAAARA